MRELGELQVEAVRLAETKTDLKEYTAEVKAINNGLNTATNTAFTAESLTRNMIEFIHKYEPVFI